MKEIIAYSQSFWPDKSTLTPTSAIYYNFRDELTYYDGILIKGSRIVIPEPMRKEILRKIHEGHQGIVKSSRRARESVWWPGINKLIQEMVKGCEICIKHHAIQHQPLRSSEFPVAPWLEIGSDLFEFHGKNYLLAVDYYLGG